MSESNTNVQRIEGIRRRTIAALDELAEKAEGFELPEPPEALGGFRRKLVENTYKVLVVGEVKRGKSTFVNALLGREILPTDVDVATSQVFEVRPAEREAYRLRFEDDSTREIAREDLPLYGSQVVEDAVGIPTLDKIIRRIEVDAPITFLPKGVSLLDTPGLGGLYAAHAQITRSLVPEADAVIYVLDSREPVLEADLKTLEELLEVTRNVFFIQTKIDLYRDDWKEVQERNREILEERFGERLADATVWPISSTHLLKASSAPEGDREAYLMASRHKDVMAALRRFLDGVVGWARSAQAMYVADEYRALARETLAGRLAGLQAESKEERDALYQAALRHKQDFDAEWGLRGNKLGELRNELQKAIAVGKQSFLNAISSGGDVERVQRERITGVPTMEEANRIAKEMPDEVVSTAIGCWTQVCREVQQRCVALMVSSAASVEEVKAVADADLSGLTAEGAAHEEFKRDYVNMLMGATRGTILVGSMSAAASLLIPGAAATLSNPAGWMLAPVVLPVIVLIAIKGVQDVRKKEIVAARQELLNRLADVRGRVYRHFFEADLASGRFSLVEEHFRIVERSVNEQVGDIVRRKTEEMNVEISRLNEAIKLGDQELKARADGARGQLAEWDRIGLVARAVMNQIKALEKGRERAPAGR